jgi:hypothetical protein
VRDLIYRGDLCFALDHHDFALACYRRALGEVDGRFGLENRHLSVVLRLKLAGLHQCRGDWVQWQSNLVSAILKLGVLKGRDHPVVRRLKHYLENGQELRPWVLPADLRGMSGSIRLRTGTDKLASIVARLSRRPDLTATA